MSSRCSSATLAKLRPSRRPLLVGHEAGTALTHLVYAAAAVCVTRRCRPLGEAAPPFCAVLYLCARRGRRTDDCLEAFAFGVFAVATRTNRLPNAALRRRKMKAVWPFLLLLLTRARPMTERARALRTLTLAPRTSKPRRSLTVMTMRRRFVVRIRFV